MEQDLRKLVSTAKKRVEEAEAKCADWQKQLDFLNTLLEADPNNAEVAELRPELDEGLATANAHLMPLLEHLAALEAQLPKTPDPSAPKFDREKHPLLKKAVEKPEVAKAVVLKPGDSCEALWQDKLWYKAKVLSVLGSASAPKYHVRFVEYDETVTADREAVRAVQTNKRKHEPEPASASPAVGSHMASVTSTPGVISGPVSMNPNAQAVKANDAADVVPEPRKRKIPNKKQLEKGVNSWKEWNSKGVGKKLSQKGSMFRTGTGINSRVGFTGSGSGMTDGNKRIKYPKAAELELAAKQEAEEKAQQAAEDRAREEASRRAYDRRAAPRSGYADQERRSWDDRRRGDHERERRDDHGRERRDDHGRERRDDHGRERRDDHGRERRGGEDRERRGGEDRERRGGEDRERRGGEDRERRGGEDRWKASPPRRFRY